MSYPVFPANWFWFVAGDETRAFSSAKAGYVAADDPGFVDARACAEPTRIQTEAELGEVLAYHGLPTGPLPAPRRDIPKSTVHARLSAIGKLAAAFTAINADPNLFGKWFAPDWPRVYADDAGLLQLLNAIGCTADQIAQVTA